MTQTIESGFKTTLSKALEAADTTMYVATAPTVTKGRVYLTNWQQEERISFTGVSGSTLTWLTRGLSQTADPATAGTGLRWIAWSVVKLVVMHDQLLDKNEPEDRVQIATTYATTAARDSALGADWAATYAYTDIYVTATGLFYDYNLSSNQWEERDTGTTTPNASETAAGKVEEATDAETTAGTGTWGTGAQLFTPPDKLATVIQSGSYVYLGASAAGTDTYVVTGTPTLSALTEGMLVCFEADVVNTGACTLNPDTLWATAIKTLDGNDPQDWAVRVGKNWLQYDGTNFVLQSEDFASTANKGIVEMATDAEATAGTDESRYINPKQALDNYQNIANAITWTITGAGTGTEIAHWLGTTPRFITAIAMTNQTTARTSVWYWADSVQACMRSADSWQWRTVDVIIDTNDHTMAITAVDDTNITVTTTEPWTWTTTYTMWFLS